MNGTRGKFFGWHLLLCGLLLASPLLLSCDAGDDGGTPTGPDAEYNPEVDPPRSSTNARVSPSTVTVSPIDDDPDTSLGDAVTTFTAYHRDPDGSPLEAVVVNFTSDPVVPFIDFNPFQALTGPDGGVSTSVTVDDETPPGSYVLVAWTSIGSGGPFTLGEAQLNVSRTAVAEAVSTPVVTGPGGAVGSFTAVADQSYTFTATGAVVSRCSPRYTTPIAP